METRDKTMTLMSFFIRVFLLSGEKSAPVS